MARVTWILANQNAEDAADSLALTVSRPAPGENDRVIPLAGTATEAVVTVLPGTEYTISITAHNQDGHRSTEPAVEFVTPASGKQLSDLKCTLYIFQANSWLVRRKRTLINLKCTCMHAQLALEP